MLSYRPQPRTYRSQAGSGVAGQNKWRSTLASLCSLGILCENYTVFPWSSTGLTSFVQGWSGFQVLFSCACHWWCDFSYFKLKPRQLIIKCDSLWGFAAFSFLLHVECRDPCCIQLVALHISPYNYIFPYHLASFDPFLTRSVQPESCQDSSCKPWPGTDRHFVGVDQLDRTCKLGPVARLALAKLIAALEGLETISLD